jgi:hypothetical protein
MKTFTNLGRQREASSRFALLFRSLLALLVGLGFSYSAMAQSTAAPSLTNTQILIAPNGSTTNVTYDADNASGNTNFQGANLGDYDVNNGKLLLNGGLATTNETGNDNVSSVTIYYRVRLSTSGGGSYTPVALTQKTLTTNADGSRTRTFDTENASQNLLASVISVSPPSYSVDVYFQATGINTTTGQTFTIPPSTTAPTNYTASFSISGTPVRVTVWTGGKNDNWFDDSNWDNGVPDATSNAVVRILASGSTNPYPNVYSNAMKPAQASYTITNPDGTVDVVPASPGYDNSNSGNAAVRNLTLQGNTPANRSILRLILGELDVYGDFINPQGSFIQRDNTIIKFAGTVDQTISGSSNGFFDVVIDGGSTKTLTKNFTVKAGGTLTFNSGLLRTDITQTSDNFVMLSDAITDGATTIPAARIVGEKDGSYLQGFVKTTQAATSGTRQDFGNIGMALTFGVNSLGNSNQPGAVLVTRDTGENNSEASFKNTKPGIRRIFGVQPANANTNSGGLSATVEFSYLDSELTNLLTSNGSTTSNDKSKLALYVSQDGGKTYSQLGRDTNNNNTLVKNGVITFATFTLSEQQAPLPVKLIAFDAKRTGTNATVTWATASEISNSGFEVQVSTDGSTFRTIAFVPSQSINSTVNLKYSFLDEEKGKTGNRYYRLRQIDVDGTFAYSPVRVVAFSASDVAAQATTLAAYPNPFSQNDLPSLMVQTATAGDARLQVLDLLGREIASQNFTAVAGSQNVAIPQSASLSAGTYMAKITLSTGEVKTVRIQKK